MMLSPDGKNKLKVLIVENGIMVTGGVKSVIRSCTVLQDRFDFLFLLPTGSQASAYVESKGFPVCEMAMTELRKDLFSLLVYGPMLLFNTIVFSRLVKGQKIDVIHSNDFYNMIPCFYKALGGSLPYICYVRFMPSKFPKALIRSWSYMHEHFASSVIAVSQAVRNELVHLRKVMVIGNELPLQEVDYSPALSKVILYPANFIPGKGQDHALRCFAAIARKHAEWRLRFIGSDMGLKKNVEYKKELSRMAVDLGIENQVEWGDFSIDMAREYVNSSIVLNFSESESFSLTCLEALFYGRPVVATDSGGPAEIIDHGESGLIVSRGDIVSMYTALDSLIMDTYRRERMALVGGERVRERYSLDRTIHRLRDQYLVALGH